MKINKFVSRALIAFLTLMLAFPVLPASAFMVEPVFQSDYASKEEAILGGLLLNQQIAAEGMVLLKNENDALPLTGKNVTVFGYASVASRGGSEGQSGDQSAGIVKLHSDVYSSLADAGLNVNPTVRASYDAWLAEAEINDDAAIAALPDFAETQAAWAASYAEYADAAIVVLSTGATEERTHSLQYDAQQYELIAHAAAHFDSVIVVINNSRPVEIPALKADEATDAILVAGQPGSNGFDALGKILVGEINPSGRTVDVWPSDFTTAPSYVNFNTTNDGVFGYGRYTVDGEMTDTYYVEYEEGIYIGYRYYETRGYEEKKVDPASTWYEDHVTYPFGYGLSYTSFKWEVNPVLADNSTFTKDDTLTFEVKVTNTGAVAGKDVVQLYYTAPYGEATTNPTKIEKAHVVLGDFAKTDELQSGESQTLTLKVKARDLASYDYVTDRTYVLDDGDYVIGIARNAHDAAASFTYKVEAKQLCDVAITGTKITNQLDNVTEGFFNTTDKRLSRADFAGTMPTKAEETRELTAEEYLAWDWAASHTKDTPEDPWYTDTAHVQADEKTRPEQAAILLKDLMDKEYDDPMWDALIDQLTLQEMADLINYGGFQTINIDYIGKPFAFDTDGPNGWSGRGSDNQHPFNQFAAEPLIASTWSKDLAYRMGVLIGDQGLWGNATAQSGMAFNYTGWYAPGMNIHRSPFDSRSTEYYSEDPLITGVFAAQVSLGAKTKGVYASMKHFAFHNDGGGTNVSFNEDGSFAVSGYRGSMDRSVTSGLSAWFDEQTAREIYLKGYQIAVEEGDASFAMASFTRLGPDWCGGSYAVNTAILRNEWGFKGAVITDIVIYGYLNADQMIRAGVDFLLHYAGMVFGVNIGDSEYTPTQVQAMRNATKNILYMVSRSNAMQLPKGTRVLYTSPTMVTAEGDTEVLKIPTAKIGEVMETFPLNTATLNVYGLKLPITYTAEGLPEGLVFDEASGIISGTPTAAGNYVVTVTASAEGFVPASVDYPLVVE